MNIEIIPSRTGSNCVKFDDMFAKFGTKDIIPLWVADMDFGVSSEIIDSIHNRLKHPIFGYGIYSDEYYDAIIYWYKQRYNWQLTKDEISPVANITSALSAIIQAFSLKGDGVMIQTPLYPPFKEIITNHERTPLQNSLKLIGGKYEIDWDDFRSKAKDAKIFLLCSPHNPTGRVWSHKEIEQMSQICQDNRALIVSDEIHSDLTHKGYRHSQIARTHNTQIITLNSPAKKFNIPSISNAYAISKDKELAKKLNLALHKYAHHTISPIAQVALIGAYMKSSEWMCKIDDYLAENLNYLVNELEDMKNIKVIVPEASFLVWIDCRNMGMNSDEIGRFFVQKLGLGLNNGVEFGDEGEGFMRLNYATSRDRLVESIKRLKTIDN